MSTLDSDRCEQSEVVYAYAAEALAPREIALAEAHIAACPECRRELASLRPLVDRLVCWPTDVLRPPRALQSRLAARIAEETGKPSAPPPASPWAEPDWEQVAPGIECKLLATDSERHRVSMLVRLAPGASYPAHTHAGIEELHLLAGELWIDERKLLPGDYNYGAPGAGDDRVWSETGCTCLLITSTEDVLSSPWRTIRNDPVAPREIGPDRRRRIRSRPDAQPGDRQRRRDHNRSRDLGG